jgi:hypothetical protein
VRKNLAERYGLEAIINWFDKGKRVGDPWKALFDIAEKNRPEGVSDLIPYWIFEEGSARVERTVPLLPFSKDAVKFKRLKKELSLYRLVFGQPRQEDLLAYLAEQDEIVGSVGSRNMISLEPPVTSSKRYKETSP